MTNNTCDMSCDLGYELVGSARRICQADGQWSGQLAYCTPLQCPPPTAPDNGFIQLPCSRDYGTVCQIRCFEKYEMNGSDIISCGLINETAGVGWSLPGHCDGKLL